MECGIAEGVMRVVATKTQLRRRSPAQIVVLVIALVVVAVHMFFTAVFNVPWSSVKYGPLPGAAADAYMSPYFVQDYRIFAPDPGNADVKLWVRAWVRSADGERHATEWVDTTAAELSSPLWKLMRKHPTVMGAERLLSVYKGLDAEARDIASRNYFEDADLSGLQRDLEAGGLEAGAVRGFIQVTNYTTSYATQVANSLWGEEEVLAVQVRAVSSPVIRWSDRFDEDAERPAVTVTDLGWRPLLEWRDQNRDGFARTFTRFEETL